MRTDSPVALRLLLILALVAIPGCAFVVVGAGAAAGVMYYEGALRAELAWPPRDVVAAAAATVGDLGFAVVSSSASEVDGEVVARTARDTRIAISVEHAAFGSKLFIRVGVFGNESLSLTIHDAILDRLNAGPHGPTTAPPAG